MWLFFITLFVGLMGLTYFAFRTRLKPVERETKLGSAVPEPPDGTHKIVENGLGEWRAYIYHYHQSSYSSLSGMRWDHLGTGDRAHCEALVADSKEKYALVLAARNRERLSREIKQTVFL